MTRDEICAAIEDESERLCVEHLGYKPTIWYTGGSEHNDDRLTATVRRDQIVVCDGAYNETYDDAPTMEAIREYVRSWLEILWGED